MNITRSRCAIAIAAAAALALTTSPAMARGWYGHHHHRDGVDAGDVLAGLLIVGGIAAIAAAASKANRDKRERERDWRYPDSGWRDAPDQRDHIPPYDRRYEAAGTGAWSGSWRSGGSMDGAVDICAERVERGDRQIESVESVSREPEGWRVDGRIEGGRDFSCTVDRDGVIRRATVDGRSIL